MAQAHALTAFRQIRNLANTGVDPQESDRQLLERFASGDAPAAFAALLRRHGPMVFGVCRRVLSHYADAEDAFQATFLVLVRRARAIRKGESLASWLHGVAYRVAVRARVLDRRRRMREHQGAVMSKRSQTDSGIAWKELQEVLDGALRGLPPKYRDALVLCYLEGRTQEEVATRLGCPLGTVRSRLAQGRKLLADRLARQGVVLPAGSLSVALLAQAAVALPEPLLNATLNAASNLISGSSVQTLPAKMAGLVQGGLRATTPARAPLLALSLVGSLIAFGVGGVLLSTAGHAVPPTKEVKSPSATPQPLSAQAEVPRPMQADLHGDALPDGARARLGTLRFRHGGTIYSAAIFPDGKRIVSGGEDRMLSVWDATTCKELFRLAGHSDLVFGVAVSPQGDRLSSAGFDRTVRIWDAANGEQLHRLDGHDRAVRCVSFSPDGKTLASCGDDKTVCLWDAATGKRLHQLTGHTDHIWCCAFSPNGSLLATASNDKTVGLWNPATGLEVGRLAGHTERVISVAFSPDGKRLVSAGLDNSVRVWGVAERKEVRRHRVDRALSAAFSPDGKVLAVGTANTTVRCWDARTGEPLARLTCEPGATERIAFAPSGDRLLSWGDSNLLRIWDLKAGQEVPPVAGHRHDVRVLTLALDGLIAVTAGEYPDLTVRFWDTKTGKLLQERSFADRVLALACCPHGKSVAVGLDGRSSLRLLAVPSGKEIDRLADSPAAVESIAYSADGTLLAAGGRDGSIHLWAAAMGKKVSQWRVHTAQVSALAFSPDGKTLASASDDRTVRFSEVSSGRELLRLDTGPGAGAFTGELAALAFAPDGRSVATVDSRRLIAGPEGTGVRLWERERGKEMRRLQAGGLTVKTIAFSPDGRTLAAAGIDRKVRLWDIASGAERCRFEGHRHTVTSLAFSADGKVLVSGSRDGTALVWEVYGTSRVEPPLDDRALKSLWADLGGDAAKAYQAACRLICQPGPTVSFLVKRLPSTKRLEPSVAAQLIADLDSPQFVVREKAARELERLGAAAEQVLRAAVARDASVQVRDEAARLLERWQQSQERLRAFRVLEVLEHAGSAESQAALNDLGEGPTSNELSTAARSALDRLAR